MSIKETHLLKNTPPSPSEDEDTKSSDEKREGSGLINATEYSRENSYPDDIIDIPGKTFFGIVAKEGITVWNIIAVPAV